ncbi:MAG: hypothetical protein JXA20_06495 [Spirochaetes bacterium]|nr:hypothetical protein [Spirochaetota bacterium]
MKLKILFVVTLSLLIVVSSAQMFSVPPYVGDVYRLYKSGYFHELDRGFSVILESFMALKTMGRPEFAWVFLQDIEKREGISAALYDRNGRRVFAPGLYSDERDSDVRRLIESVNPVMQGSVSGGRYRAVMPLRCEDRCRFCHQECRGRGYIGAMIFERDYDGHIYYSSERVIIFLSLTVLLSILLFLLLRWVPGRNVKELFDK